MCYSLEMNGSNINLNSEREQTDENLYSEREKADQAILNKKKILEDEADALIQRAREKADTVIAEAREKTDYKIANPEAAITQGNTIEKKRVVEDKALQTERDVADRNKEQERKEVTESLRSLLPLEREATDRTLLTERARSDEALENRDDFLGMVCHDLRDLLSGIVLNTELVKQEASKGEDGNLSTKAALQIQRYAALMNRLIGDLVDVVSIDSGKISMVQVREDTTALITEALHAFQAAARAKGITLDAVSIQDAVFAEFDHDRMLQVFANLIMNSIKFTPQGGTITLEREEKGNELWFSVRDTGSGIPSDMLELIFEQFWQVAKNDRRGRGLGLYISKCIIESHGGRIWVESKPSEGSRFIFTLPRKV